MRKFLIIGLLALSMVFVSCGNGTTDNNGGNTEVLTWVSMGFVDGPYTSTSVATVYFKKSELIVNVDRHYDLKENIGNKIVVTDRRTKEEFIVCEDYIRSEDKYTVQFIGGNLRSVSDSTITHDIYK